MRNKGKTKGKKIQPKGGPALLSLIVLPSPPPGALSPFLCTRPSWCAKTLKLHPSPSHPFLACGAHARHLVKRWCLLPPCWVRRLDFELAEAHALAKEDSVCATERYPERSLFVRTPPGSKCLVPVLKRLHEQKRARGLRWR